MEWIDSFCDLVVDAEDSRIVDERDGGPIVDDERNLSIFWFLLSVRTRSLS